MKTIVITGATQGMGKALALTYLDRGDNVVIVGRRAPLDVPTGERTHVIEADLSLVSECDRVIDQVTSAFPAVDALVLCARHFNTNRVVTAEGFEHTFALFYLSRLALVEGLLALLERAEHPVVMNVAGPGEEGGEIHWDDLGIERGYHGGVALGQGGSLNDLLGVGFVERHPAARTRYVLFHPGIVSTTFSGDYDETTAPHIERLRRTGKPVAEAIAPIIAAIDAPPAAPLSAFMEGRPLATDGTAFDRGAARRLDGLTRQLLPTVGQTGATATAIDNRDTLRRYVDDVINAGDFDTLDDYVHADVVLPLDMPAGRQGREGLREHLREIPAVLQTTTTIEDLIAEGDKVAARVLIHGTHVGDFMGRPPSGARFAIEEQLIAQFRDGKVSRFWRVVDVFSLLHQLDAKKQPTGTR